MLHRRTATFAALLGVMMLLIACSRVQPPPVTVPVAAQSAPIPSMVVLRANLSGSQVVPPVTTSAGGVGAVTFDPTSKRMTFNVSWFDVPQPVTAAHFHGEAYVGANARVILPIGDANPRSPVSGEDVLTDALAAELVAGHFYIDVHTAKNPNGLIRGQVTR